MRIKSRIKLLLHAILYGGFFICISQPCLSQIRVVQKFQKPTPYNNDEGQSPFGKSKHFIENIGQYGATYPDHPELGRILYGYEGLGMPILVAEKGLIILQRKLNTLTKEDGEELEKSGALNGYIDEGKVYRDGSVTFEWVNSSALPKISSHDEAEHYFLFASQKEKARGFGRLVAEEIYPGIDLILTTGDSRWPGIEYSFLVKPGADPSTIKIRPGGEIKEIIKIASGGFEIINDIEKVFHSSPVTSYSSNDSKNKGLISSRIEFSDDIIQFEFPNGFDASKAILIDPFIHTASNLSGNNAGIAKDIDFDYDGNIYVTGGGGSTIHQMAKYSPGGNLLWTFNGNLATQSWTFGINYGGWVVEKTTGKIYLGQGGSGGFRIVRLGTDGFYDNYITSFNSDFQENWKMIWNCEGGSPRIFIAGGGSANHNINLGICTPPSLVLTSMNLTGQPLGHQDIADMVIDPENNELYTLFAQGFVTPITENNRLYKHKSPYAPSNRIWTRLSGFDVLSERANRPYLADVTGFNDNSINGIAITSRYFFYYDGRNLAAMDKATGTTIATPVLLPLNSLLLQGGIAADECGNVYIGSTNGTIVVYRFNGTSFDDNAARDILIAGYPTSSIYDLALDAGKNLLYVAGKGFVGSIDISSYCASAIYNLSVTVDCPSLTATGTITPALPAGASLTYQLYEGTRLINSNTNGYFTDLLPSTDYTLKALINEACGGFHSVKDFNLGSCSPTGPFIGSGIYVPAGFTPNGDGLNDILTAIPYGIKEFKYFTVFNRWGQRVFYTTNYRKGWDGKINGQPQGSSVFVWIAEAITNDNKPIRLKGTTTLIR